MKAREIQEKLSIQSHRFGGSVETRNTFIDQSLLALKEMVLQLRRKSTTSRIHSYDKGFNSAIESVAKLFEDSK